MLKSINQILVFTMELVMLGAFAIYGYNHTTLVNRYVFSFALVAIAIGLWGVFAAPKSLHRLSLPFLVLFRAAMFLTASFLLFLSGYKTLAVVMGVLSVVTQTYSYFMEKN